MFYYCSWNPIQASQQDGALAEIVPQNNSSAIDARYTSFIGIYSVLLTLHSVSFFHNANNFVVRDGTFYAAHNLVIKRGGKFFSWLSSEVLIYVLDYDRTPKGIVEGADVVCFDNGHLKEFSPTINPPSSSLLPGMSSRRKRYIKVEGIEFTLPIALPKEERSRSNCMKEVVLKM